MFKMGDNAGPTEKMALLRELVQEGVSFRSAQVGKVLFDKTAPTFDLKKYAKTFAAKMKKEGFSIKDLMEAVQAQKAV